MHQSCWCWVKSWWLTCACVCLSRCVSARQPVRTCSVNTITSKHFLYLVSMSSNLKRSERDELELLSLFLEGRVVGMRVASAGLMGEKTSIRSLTEGGWGGEVREGRGRGLLEEEKRESGHHVPTKLVVHIPLVSKVGQGRERTRHRGRRDRERGSGSSTKLSGINSNVRACLFLAACQHLTESIFTIKTARLRKQCWKTEPLILISVNAKLSQHVPSGLTLMMKTFLFHAHIN